MNEIEPPLGLLAELTHRCPLSCAYCSNPIDLERRSSELDTANWVRVFSEAASLGVLHVHLSGGEPTARADIVDLTRAANQAGLYTNLITSGVGVGADRVAALAEAGLDHLQLSVQDALPDEADRMSGLAGSHAAKREAARRAVAARLALTINAVVHRGNIARIPDLVAEAVALGAGRIEIAHAQYHGWALANREALMPTREQVVTAREAVGALRRVHADRIAIDYVAPDYYARFPKPCMNGWGRRTINVTPSGVALPCHSAQTIPDLFFWNVRDHSLREIWESSPAFAAFRGTEWMREPCNSCARKDIDFGGCRCQALALTGDARNTDPVCSLSPMRDNVLAALSAAASASPLRKRRYGARDKTLTSA